MINKLIYQAQEEVSNNNSYPYYEIAYKGEEISYWTDLINWIYVETHGKDSQNILDIGTAYGTLLMYCKIIDPQASLTTVDFVRYMSQELIDRHNIDYRLANFETDNIEFDKTFDVILLTEVLEHFNFNPIPTLKKIHALLSDSGSLFISTPNSGRWGRLGEYQSYKDLPNISDKITIRDQHIYQFSFDELIELLDECGFQIVNISPSYSYHINIQVKKRENNV